jgi:hypothetical protein
VRKYYNNDRAADMAPPSQAFIHHLNSIINQSVDNVENKQDADDNVDNDHDAVDNDQDADDNDQDADDNVDNDHAAVDIVDNDYDTDNNDHDAVDNDQDANNDYRNYHVEITDDEVDLAIDKDDAPPLFTLNRPAKDIIAAAADGAKARTKFHCSFDCPAVKAHRKPRDAPVFAYKRRPGRQPVGAPQQCCFCFPK